MLNAVPSVCVKPVYTPSPSVLNNNVPSVAGMYAFQQNVGNAFEGGIVTATPNSDDATKTDFVIDIEAAAIDLVAPLIDQSSLGAAQVALAAGSATDEQLTLLAEYDQALIQAQQWLTRNLGVDPATEVTGELPIEIGITTRDTNNILSDVDGFSEEIVTSGIVNIVDINDLPIITNSSEDSHYFHNNLELHPNIVMEDIDNENFNNGVITVTITPYGESPFELIEGEDEINISTENGISVDADNNVYFEENVIGSIISSTRLGDLRISLNENANLDAVQRVMQSLFYVNNSGHEPVEGQRNISMSFQDGSGPNEAGETEVIVDRIVTVFRGASGTTGNDIVSADT